MSVEGYLVYLYRRAQPTVGNTIPWASGYGLYEKTFILCIWVFCLYTICVLVLSESNTCSYLLSRLPSPLLNTNFKNSFVLSIQGALPPVCLSPCSLS